MQVEVKRAQAGDIPVIEAILRDVAEWLDRGGQHQWSAEDVSWKSLSRDYQIEEFYIVYRMGEPVACMALQIDPLVRNISVVLTAMPAGATTAILALKYRGDAAFASACTALTTVLSLAAVPVWCALLL